MATQLFRIGKQPNNVQQKPREDEEQGGAHFELEDSARGQMDGQSVVLGSVQERFAGFFEVPERCVPFAAGTFDDEFSEEGFPAAIELPMCSSAQPSPSDLAEPRLGNDEAKANPKKKGNKSLFARHFDQIGRREEKSINSQEAKVLLGTVDQSIRNLEPMLDPLISAQSNRTESIQSTRFAIDPVHSDFAVKCLRNVVSRQENQFIRLFDILGAINPSQNSFSPQMSPEIIHILDEAKRSIDQIRPLYLEQIQNGEGGRVGWQFARRFVDPFSDGAWTLSPIRRVLDAVQLRNPLIATSDDVEIVRLTLLWTVLLLLERPVLFRASVNVSEFFCRLAEVYLTGPEVFLYDQQIHNCVGILIYNFLVDACQKGLMALRLHEPIASLDQFMPFYEDLLQNYENFSAGDDNFTLLLLTGAYLNSSRLDGLLMAQTLWSPKRNVVRQMILSEEKADPFLPYIFANERSVGLESDDGHSQQQKQLLNAGIAKLMANYACALKEGTVIKSRNGAMCAIAFAEIKQFIQHNAKDKGSVLPSVLVEDLKETLTKFLL